MITCKLICFNNSIHLAQIFTGFFITQERTYRPVAGMSGRLDTQGVVAASSSYFPAQK